MTLAVAPLKTVAPDARDRILEAAEQLVAEAGTSALTFERISERTRISRGGVLHHFRSKEALIEAMVQRFAAELDRTFAHFYEADDQPIGRATRSYIHASFGLGGQSSKKSQRVASALLAALYTSPAAIAPLTDQHRRYQLRIEQDGLDPVMATILRMAVEGLWLGEAFGNNRLPRPMRDAVLKQLIAISYGGRSMSAPKKRRR